MLLLLLACTSSKDTGAPADDCPRLALSNSSVHFDPVQVGSVGTATLLAANDCASGAALELALSVDDSAFVVATTSVVVDAGAVGAIDLTWTPTSFDPAAATLALGTNDPSQATVFVPLSGTPVPDGDGVDEVDEVDDCDDGDPAVHPGATEVWYDGVDQDCDGNDDDQDGDGFAISADCVDTDATVSPSGTEFWYDGIDQDCDGNDDDQDGDGFVVGADCGDTDASISPGAAGVWYDGADQGCAGGNDRDQDGDGVALYPSGADCNDLDASTTAGSAEVVDGVDNDCNGLVDDGSASADDVLATEIMANPDAVSDTVGGWFEVYNPSTVRVDLVGWTVYSDDGGSFTVASSVPIDPGGYAVFGVEADSAANGGVELDYVDSRTDFSFSDTGDTVYLVAGTTTVVELSYSARWGVCAGASLSLDPDRLEATNAAVAASGCDATSPLSGGDTGTPGATNDLCSGLDHDGDRQSAASGDRDDTDATVYYGALETRATAWTRTATSPTSPPRRPAVPTRRPPADSTCSRAVPVTSWATARTTSC